jgi:hypothetical protein
VGKTLRGGQPYSRYRINGGGWKDLAIRATQRSAGLVRGATDCAAEGRCYKQNKST